MQHSHKIIEFHRWDNWHCREEDVQISNIVPFIIITQSRGIFLVQYNDVLSNFERYCFLKIKNEVQIRAIQCRKLMLLYQINICKHVSPLLHEALIFPVRYCWCTALCNTSAQDSCSPQNFELVLQMHHCSSWQLPVLWCDRICLLTTSTRSEQWIFDASFTALMYAWSPR